MSLMTLFRFDPNYALLMIVVYCFFLLISLFSLYSCSYPIVISFLDKYYSYCCVLALKDLHKELNFSLHLVLLLIIVLSLYYYYGYC